MNAMRMILLGAALAPYVALAGADAWMHERARRVPRVEQILHYSAAFAFVGFAIAAFRDSTRAALTLLSVFAIATAWDELAYHRHLDRRERRLHFASFAALVLFLAVWVRISGPA
jgi:hypothetical protein